LPQNFGTGHFLMIEKKNHFYAKNLVDLECALCGVRSLWSALSVECALCGVRSLCERMQAELARENVRSFERRCLN